MSTTGETRNRLNSPHVDFDDDQYELKVPVVRQLKPPPEIWELVQPVPPKQSRLGSGFTLGLPSGRTMFVLLVAVTLLIGGYLAVRSGKRTGTGTPPVERARQVDSSKAAVADRQKSTAESNVANIPRPVVASSDNQTTAVVRSEKPKRKTSRSKPVEDVSAASSRPDVTESVSAATGSEVSLPSNQKTRPSATTRETTGVNTVDSVSSPKPKTSLSPQLIDSSKTAPRKSKVIQWP